MRSYQKVLAILAIVIPLCQNIHSSTCDSTSLALMEQTWREFRAIHPFGFQTVGLKHYGDTCVFVMSEPAEWVKAEELRDLFSEYDGHLIIGRKSFGYDGGLYDAIGCAKLNPINFKSMERNLFKLLYGTDYKPYYTDLDNPFNHIYYSNYIFDYFVPNFYWYNWRKSMDLWPNNYGRHNKYYYIRKIYCLGTLTRSGAFLSHTNRHEAVLR